MEYSSARGAKMPCAKRASSSSIPSRGMNAWPAQKKKIHKIQAGAALRRDSGWGFTAGRLATETEMVSNVRQCGPEWRQQAIGRLARGLLMIRLVQASKWGTDQKIARRKHSEP